ncbi:lipid asymmetry ABC transporter MlaABCDEF, lipoprotein MlaA [Campylobacter vicugnae]|uniref:Lipid asymmetry ABC transporter MlaABCDEF, lipoprotein MlaA n=1 Tax=Campylobacter vicugnae TaxID=1660076 RepID=A0A1X9T2N6_9BACT|nr:VacJ family lipoprotein [Campylobacter sp. RM8964]ARR02770.1 lipid asymmetry ABC transporter MlaABCDEF, lipoprotein MlaA [Campylobacter sp. RM8964]
MARIFLASFIFLISCFADDIDSFEDEYATSSFDPLSGYNRVMTEFNHVVYQNILIPTFKGYDYIMPDPAQDAIGNFFDNLMFPIRLVNNLLQFKFAAAGEETLRFIANTIIGFGGISDAATNVYGLKKHNEDFGQTLGYWGIGSGFPIVLPILGQTNLRDLVGMGGDFFINPLTYTNEVFTDDGNKYFHLNLAAKSWQIINDGSMDPELYNKLTSGAIDLYSFMKDGYEQRRNAQIQE